MGHGTILVKHIQCNETHVSAVGIGVDAIPLLISFVTEMCLKQMAVGTVAFKWAVYIGTMYDCVFPPGLTFAKDL